MMSDILRRARLINREIFDPTNAAHIESFKIFLRTGNWGDVQFYPEVPYTEAPATVMAKYSRHILDVEVETAVERSDRLAARGVLQFPTTETREQKDGRISTANAIVRDQLQALRAREQAA